MIKSVPFTKGLYKIELIYDRLRTDDTISPLEIISIRVEGEKEGSADTCKSCPIVSLLKTKYI